MDSAMRYERKYRIESCHLDVVLQAVRNHPASFRKIYPDRQINNVYWDTIGLQSYKDNVMGIAERQKIRIRWYGESMGEIHNSKLEIKKRINELGIKDVFNMPFFQLAKVADMRNEIRKILKKEIFIQPVLLNSYRRSYWGTPDKKFRITIDNNMFFHSFLHESQFVKYIHNDKGIVLELKYESEEDCLSDRISQFIPFRRSKNSKFIQGIDLINY